jgi:hypothetical protein
MTAPWRPEPPHLDPDPRYVDPDLEAVRAELRSSRRLVGVLAFTWLLAFLAMLSIAWLLVATPRSAPDPTTPPPGASGTLGSVDVPARAEASTSGPELSGAPLEDSRDLSFSGRDRQAGKLGGAPQTLPDTATVIGGTATWLCDPPRWTRCTKGYPEGSFVGARGSEIPASWRGKIVRVWHGRRHVDVRIVDACACKGDRVIDLYAVAFQRLAPTSAGEISVRVELLGSGALPPTGTTP